MSDSNYIFEELDESLLFADFSQVFEKDASRPLDTLLTDMSRLGSAASENFSYVHVETGEPVNAVKPAKKRRKLEANKVAAKKYREKKQNEVHILRDRVTCLRQNNETLASLLEDKMKRIQELENTIQQLSKRDTVVVGGTAPSP